MPIMKSDRYVQLDFYFYISCIKNYIKQFFYHYSHNDSGLQDLISSYRSV